MTLKQRTLRFMRKETSINRAELLFLIYAGMSLGISITAINISLAFAALVFSGIGFWFMRSKIKLRSNWKEPTSTTKQANKKEGPPPEDGDNDHDAAPIRHISEKDFTRID